MIKRLLACLFGLLCFACIANSATLLPPGEMTFLDGNGQPLAGGRVYFYIPNTSTPKDTYQNAAQTVLNSNPVILDGSGRAVIYGSGTYREVVQDLNGNTIWDQLTADTSANNFSWAGTSAGTANAQTLTAPNFTQGDGQTIGFVAGLSNTGALTISVNGGAAISVTKATTSGPIALTGSEVIANNQYEVTYSAASGNFQLVAYPIPPGIGLAVSIAAASTTDIGTATNHDVSVTGVANINSLGASASISAPFYLLQFVSTPTLVESAALVTPSGSNLTVAAGTSALAVYQGSGNWQIVSYSAAMTPSGEVSYFNLAACPPGWLTANGSNGTPDMRGVYARGLDLGRGLDPTGTGLAGFEAEAVQPLGLSFGTTAFVGTTSFNGLGGTGGVNVPSGAPYNLNGNVSISGTGTETRPVTTVLLACMKQ